MFRLRFALGLAKCLKPFNSMHAFTYPQQYQYQQKMLLGYCQSRFYFSSHSSTAKDYYKILGVEEQATQEEIKKQFHKLAKLYHPDSSEKTGNDEEQFKEASEAYNILGDVIKRAKYDSERNLDRQRNEEASRQYNRFFKGGAGAYSQTHANYEAHQNAYAQSQRQSKQDEQRYKTYQDYQGFQKRDFDAGNMVPEGLWANMKDAPELWVISGIMLLLMLRWFIQSTTEHKNSNYSPDDDFEGGVTRGRIKLRPEDVKGMSLTQMDELDATGKYQLPPNAKATLEEYRSIARAVDYDTKKYNKLKNQQQQQQEDDSFQDIEDDDEEEEGREAQRQREIVEKIKQEQRELMMAKMEWEEAGLERKLQAQQQNSRPKVQNYRTSTQLQAYERNMKEKDLQNNLRKEQQSSDINNNSTSAGVILESSNQGKAVPVANKTTAKDNNNTSSSSIQLEMISKLDPKQLQIFGVAKKAPKEEAETLDNQVVSNANQKVEHDISIINNIKTSQSS